MSGFLLFNGKIMLMANRWKTHTTTDGFTVVELLFTLFVTVIVFTTYISVTIVVHQTSARTDNYLAANSVAFAKMQEYETKSFTSIPVGVPGNSYEVEDYSSAINPQVNNELNNPRGKVYVMPESGSLVKIRVTLTFADRNGDRTIEYGSYVQLGGAGR